MHFSKCRNILHVFVLICLYGGLFNGIISYYCLVLIIIVYFTDRHNFIGLLSIDCHVHLSLHPSL